MISNSMIICFVSNSILIEISSTIDSTPCSPTSVLDRAEARLYDKFFGWERVRGTVILRLSSDEDEKQYADRKFTINDVTYKVKVYSQHYNSQGILFHSIYRYLDISLEKDENPQDPPIMPYVNSFYWCIVNPNHENKCSKSNKWRVRLNSSPHTKAVPWTNIKKYLNHENELTVNFIVNYAPSQKTKK